MDRETYPNAKVVNLAKKLIPCKQDAGQPGPMKVAEKYKVGAVPTLLFVDAKGKEVYRFEGYRPPDEFVKEMNTALKKAP